MTMWRCMTAAGRSGETGWICRSIASAARTAARASPAGRFWWRLRRATAPGVEPGPWIADAMRGEDLGTLVVHGQQLCLRAGFTERVRPVRRLGDRQELPGQLGQRVAQAALGHQVDLTRHLERRDRDERLLRDLRCPQLGGGCHGFVDDREQDGREVDLRELGAVLLTVHPELIR